MAIGAPYMPLSIPEFLYIANTAIACIAYAPQCLTLWRMLKTDQVDKSVSLATWTMWAYACGVTLLYALTEKSGDWAFLSVSAVNALFCAVTVVLTFLVHRRYNQKNREGKQ